MDQLTPLAQRRDEVLNKIVDICLAAGPVETQTDKYFSNTARIVGANGDAEVTYAVFLRRRVVAALEPTIRLISRLVPGTKVRRFFNEGDLVPSEKKILEVTGSMAKLSEIETLLLQKTGFPCVSANNAYEMCRAIPTAGFMDMHARHASGAEMNLLASYGAAVGSEAARRADAKVKGFIGSSQDLTAPLFGAAAALLVIAPAASAQREVSGRVTLAGSGEPIPDASVGVVGIPVGARTNARGEYRLRVPDGEVTLATRMIGYKRQTARVPAGQTTVNFELEKDVLQLEAITVTGAATTMERRNATSSVSQVSADQLERVARR